MAEQLLSIIMNDGSRHFGDLPQTVLWHELRVHIGLLDGAAVSHRCCPGSREFAFALVPAQNVLT